MSMPVYLPCSAQTLRSLIIEIQQFRDGLSSPGFVALSDSLMSVLWNMSVAQFTDETTGLAIEALEMIFIIFESTVLPIVIPNWVLGSCASTNHPDESQAIHRLMHSALLISQTTKDPCFASNIGWLIQRYNTLRPYTIVPRHSQHMTTAHPTLHIIYQLPDVKAASATLVVPQQACDIDKFRFQIAMIKSTYDGTVRGNPMV